VFDDLKIRNKLVCLVAGPIVIIVALAAIGARARQDTAADSRQVETLVAVARANSDVVDAMQQEALAGTAFVAAGRGGDTKALARARKRTDQVLEESLRLLSGSSQGTSSGFRSASRLAVDAADKLQYIREAVDQGYRWDQVATTFSALEQSFLAVNETVSAAITDPQVAGQLRTAGALATYKTAIARQGSMLVGAGEQGGFDADGTYDLFRTAVTDEESERAIFDSIAEVSRKGDVRNALASEAHIDLEGARDQALAAGADGPGPADAGTMTKSTAEVLGDLHGVETDLFGAVIAQSRAASSDAARAANAFVIAAVVAILAAAIGAVLVGRRITRPLDKLTVAANHLATKQMPRLVESLRNPSEDELDFQLGNMEAIKVSSNDEIGQLASSFNDVQRVAGEVATEQAALLRKGIGEMFVNLARRNQALLDRQIEFIDELERGEEDPDQLENLYRLDHLATRMRRNAESLLVLAGAEPARRRGRPAPLANVVRAALAEVEDFGRIELLSFDEVLVASNAAADLAHLLSELMENATNFSPPETKVDVVGHRTKADGYVISVSDHGIGMSGDQIAEANDSLAKPPLVGLALSRSLGFIVVGRLAGRHGITVRTMPSPAGGLTAVVSLPSTLVTDAPSLGGGPAPTPEVEVPRHLEPVMDTPTPTASAPSSSSSLPPLEFTPYEAARPAPASLAEAVPTGQAFELGLDALVAAPPPPAPLPEAPVHDVSSRPFFLEETEPPRPVGGVDDSTPPPDQDAPTAEPTRLFGAASASAATPPLARRSRPGAAPAAPAESPPPEAAADGSTTNGSSAEGPGTNGSGTNGSGTNGSGKDAGQQTTAGLTKRVPRQAGATRAIPGADAERGVGATRRSPDEVRSLLSSYRAGQQRARVEVPATAGSTEEMEDHE